MSATQLVIAAILTTHGDTGHPDRRMDVIRRQLLQPDCTMTEKPATKIQLEMSGKAQREVRAAQTRLQNSGIIYQT